MVDIVKLKTLNAARWAVIKVNPNLLKELDLVANRLVAAKTRYLTVSSQTTVPWFVIAVIHEREASQSWAANLAQGDPWDKVSVHVPKGQGPFKSWEDAAVNALSHTSPFAAHWGDWSVGGTLTLLEEYNGLGYAMRGMPSPYVWASTNQYSKGKFIADGHFDPNAIDHQMGCAALISRIKVLDPSITFGD
jgi:lysozyme family protein